MSYSRMRNRELIRKEKMEGLAAVVLNGHVEGSQQCSFEPTGRQLGSSASFMLE